MRHRFSTRFLLAILGALSLGAGTTLMAQTIASYQVVEVVPDAQAKQMPGDKVPEYPQFAAPLRYESRGMDLTVEVEPNDTTATANALAGTEAVVYGTIEPAADVDYFAFTANAGDRVSVATMTSFSHGGSTDTEVSVIASDGTTVLQFDDDRGSFSSLSSAISGTIIPAAGTYYILVDGASTTSTITPYHLHLRVLSGAPTAEVEPNNDPGNANPLPPAGWMSGTVTATTDPDFFWVDLSAGDSVYLTLDMDPDRNPTNTNWNGRLGIGIFGDTASPLILVANDGSTTKPHAEAFFYTVKEAGTYYVYVDSTSSTGLGADARYHLSVRVIPKQLQTDCTVITSIDVPKTLGPDGGTVTTSVIDVPPTVTSSINDVNVLIDLNHTNMPDLDVTLSSPAGTTINLFTDIGSSTQVEMDLGLDDNAALPIGTFSAVSGMINEPEGGTAGGQLVDFNGQLAGGTWTLTLTDDLTNTGGGTLNNWSLEICGEQPPAYGLTLTKTVGLDPTVCASGSVITAPPGATVYYCYTVSNTGLNDLITHDLVDDQLGTILSGFAYVLTPGSSINTVDAGLTLSTVVNATVTNNATWIGYGATGAQASGMASATVNVTTHCPAGYQDVTLAYADFEGNFPPAGWAVANTSVNCNPPGVPEWTNTDPDGRGNLTGGAGLFAIADSDACGSGSTLDTTLTTPALDLTGLTDPRAYFATDYNDIATGGDQGVLEVSTDGGGTWTPVITWDEDHRGPLFVEQAIPGEGVNGVLVQWHYVNGTFDWWWEVDDAWVTACQEAAAPPNIDVSPLTLGATQPPNTVTGQVMTIGNTGGSDLDWAITEDVGATTKLVDWSDNFDAYATGVPLHGLGGWKGWYNDPTASALTSSAQARSAPNSVDIVGNSDMVHEHVASDGSWVYTAWQYIPGAFTGESYFILLNQYDDSGATNNWSTQIHFNAASNTVIADGVGGGASLPLIRDAWVEIRVEIDLVADTQAFYYANQLLFSGSWSSGLSGGGITSIGAVDLFANGASSIYYDDLSLVEQVQVCAMPTDIPWLSTVPTVGTTPPAGSTPVDVLYDSTGLAAGTYTANLCVESNDPDPGPGNGTDLVVLPVTLNVEEQVPPDIDVSPPSLATSQLTNVITTLPLTIGNVGGSDLVWTIEEEPLVVAPVATVPPVETLNPEVDLEAELRGRDSEKPSRSVREPAAAARARNRLGSVGLLLIPDSSNDRVMAFDPITGDLVDADFIPTDPTNLSTPKSAILNATGDAILVSDQVDDVVQAYDLDGNYLGVFAPAGGANTAILDNILGIDLRPNDNLLVPVDSGANQDSVAEFDTAGNYLGNFIAIGAGGLDGGFDVFPLGTDWLVTSINSDNVLRFDAGGAPLGVFAPAVAFGEQINIAGNGNVLVANFSTPNSGVMEFTPAGALVGVYSAVTGNRGVYELPSGNILTTNGSGVHEIDRSGNLVSTKYAGTGAQYIEFVAPTAGCTNLADVPWLAASPTGGTIPAAGNQEVTVTFDSTGLAVGFFEANLCVFSNDPVEPVVPVPVTMEVVIPVELQSFTIE